MTILPVIPTSPDQPDVDLQTAGTTRRRPAMPPRHLADLDLAARKAAVNSDPAKPSQVLPGLMLGASLCRPRNTPNA